HFSLFSKALREYASPYITPQMYRQMLYWNAWAHFIGGDTRYPDANEFWADWDPATKTIRYRSWIHHTILGSSNWTIIEDVMGLRPRSDAKVELWPIDIGWDHFTVDNLRYRNVDLSIVWDRPGDGTVHYPGVPEGYSIFVDGKRRVTVDALVHTVWDPARREVTFPEGGGTTLFTADGRRPKAPTEHRLSGERIKDLFQKAGLDLDGAGPDLVREATASHGDPDGAVDGFTINEPHWSSKGSGRPRDWVEVDLGGAR